MAAAGSSHGKWRDTEIDWSEQNYAEQRRTLANKKPPIDGINNYKVLLVGPITAGKSSVVNTMVSALRNEICNLAHNASSEKSVTRKFRQYWLRESVTNKAASILMCDTMGFEESQSEKGPSQRDIEYLMDGNIRDGYEFDTDGSVSFSSDKFNANPTLSDKVHAMLVVVDAGSFAEISREVLDRLKLVARAANERDIRWGVIMTKVDIASVDAKRDLRDVYQSEDLLTVMYMVQEKLGANPTNIFPMLNYCSEVTTSLPINVLSLHVLNSVLRLADNSMEAQAGLHLRVDDPEPEETPLLTEPWQNVNAFDCDTLSSAPEFEYLLNIAEPGIKVILMGPNGGGKSAFINSAQSVFYDRVWHPAETSTGGETLTNMYTEYELREGRDGDGIPMWLCDTRGQCQDGSGLLRDDLNTVLTGQVPNKTQFNSGSAINLEELGAPANSSAVRILVYVFRADADLSDKEVQNYKDAVEAAKRQGVPYVVLLTKVDHVCPHVERSARHVFHSQAMHEVVMRVTKTLQIPKVQVLLASNVHNDCELDKNKALLILHTLCRINEYAMDHSEHQQTPPGHQQEQQPGLLARWLGWKK